MAQLSRRSLLVVGAVSAGSLALPLRAQAAWPARSVKIVVPFAAGGNTDSIARLLAERFTQTLGQPFVVENRVGAGGGLAIDFVSKSAPDGYTLLVGAMANLAILPVINKVSFDPIRDFIPISNIGSNPFVLGIHRSVPATTVQEFIDHVRKNPGKFNYASGGSGSVSHLSGALFVKRAGIEMAHVSYKGGSQAVVDLLAGNVQMYFGNFSELVPHANGGQIRLIGVSSDQRVPQIPNVPTISESGLPGFRTITWNGLLAPAGTPQAIIDRAAAVAREVVASEGARARFAQIGVDPIGSTPAEFAATLRADLQTWAEAAKIANLKME
ncbi:MAG: Bug family tripartite tricarboxylate transporter substrate binding protein [Betaproteobacteria bacterium]